MGTGAMPETLSPERVSSIGSLLVYSITVNFIQLKQGVTVKKLLYVMASMISLVSTQTSAGTSSLSSSISTVGVASFNFVVTQPGSYTFSTLFASPGGAYTFVGDRSNTPNSFITGASGSSSPLAFTAFLSSANPIGYYFQIANFGSARNFATTVSSLDGGFIEGGGFTHQVSAVPEPETFAMLLAGLGLAGYIARRRNKKSVGDFACKT